MYGKSLIDQISDMCRFFEIENANILFEDAGAFALCCSGPFLRSLLKRLFPDCLKEYLLPMNKKNLKSTKIDRLIEEAGIYLPGNEPKFFVNAGLHNPDGIILDLEDSVAPSEKDAVQLIVRNALRSVDFYGSERMVRINQLPKGLEDLKFICA